MELKRLLDHVAEGRVKPGAAMRMIEATRERNLGFARVDMDRLRRRGLAEVVFCQGKTPAQVARIAAELVGHGQNLLATRASPEQYEAVKQRLPRAVYHVDARCITLDIAPHPRRGGLVVVVSAGTTDIPVAEEAALVAERMGARVTRLFDVGVAGLHRLLPHLPLLRRARALVVAAGMEGALPSVVGGLTDCPIVAVPTSVGYGSSLKGATALLAMLNSCVPGIGVMNIDNGFGAGVLAAMINRLPEKHRARRSGRSRRP